MVSLFRFLCILQCVWLILISYVPSGLCNVKPFISSERLQILMNVMKEEIPISKIIRDGNEIYFNKNGMEVDSPSQQRELLDAYFQLLSVNEIHENIEKTE